MEKINQLFTLQAISRSSITYVNYQAEFYAKQLNKDNKQNSFSFLKKVIVTSKSDNDLFNVRLHISFSAPFIKCQDTFISCLEGHKSTEIDTFSISIDAQSLYKVNEQMPNSVTLTLLTNQEETLASIIIDLKILPISESASEERIPEILTSFITPNDQEVANVTYKASLILQRKYMTPSFSGYQYNDPNKVLEQIDAIYCALEEESIMYVNPPASFEKVFQRVRLPFEVLKNKLGTCLDLALLFCSAVESVGLYPVLIILNGHSFAGCFLEDTHLASSLEDNPSEIVKLASKGYDRLCLVECTSFISKSHINFEQAREIGIRNLLGDQVFLYALDIFNCRQNMILPLPTPVTHDGKTEINYQPSSNIKYTLSHIDTSSRGFIDPNTKKAKDKFDYWEEKLLDLNLRNKLINFRIGRNVVQVMDTDADIFLDRITSPSRFLLQPFDLNKDTLQEGSVIDFEKTKYEKKFLSTLDSKQIICTSLNERETQDNLKSLARKAKTILEESGSNSLFLTLGLIKWYPTEKAGEAKTGFMSAPVFLIPVRIPVKKLGQFYQLDADEDSVSLNTTALEYFKQNFNLDFSSLDGALPLKKDGKANIRLIYNTIREIISTKKGWELIDEISCISTFSFAHFVMWNDIKNRRADLMKNKIVSSLVEGRKSFSDNADSSNLNLLDSQLSPSSLAVPLYADSSQIKAILDSSNGKSFILDGPPGTGKSQTIANMIVNALYSHKRVLFVAEKEVALQVVKDRLDKLGLGDFCLQIHSNKAVKSEVLDNLNKAIEKGHLKNPSEYKKESDDILAKRNSLNSLVTSLHTSKGFFVSIYDSIIIYLDNSLYKGRIDISDETAKKMTSSNYSSILLSLEQTALLGKEVNSYKDNPLIPFKSRNYDIQKRDRLFSDLVKLNQSLSQLEQSASFTFSTYFNGLPSTKKNLSLVFSMLYILKDNNGVIFKNLDSKQTELKANEIDLYFKEQEEKKVIEKSLFSLFKEDILNLDASILYKEFKETEQSSFIKKFFTNIKITGALNKYSKYKKAANKSNTCEILNSLIRLKALNQLLTNTNSYLLDFTNGMDFSSKEKCSHYKKAFENSKTLIELSKRMDRKENTDNTSVLSSVICSFKDNPNNLYSSQVTSFFDGYMSFKEQINKLNKEYEYDLFAFEDQDNYLSYLLKKLDESLKSQENLAMWTKLLNNLDYLNSKDLYSLTLNYKKGQLKEDDLVKAFKCNLFYKIAVLGIKEENLSDLDSASIDKLICDYKKDVEDFKMLSVQETAARITSYYPDSSINYASSSPFYCLNKLIKSHGRATSLRKIFTDYRDLILTICPCLLMSPLSVAQYLELGNKPFDLVIFDEASQIPTSEAIGAISRGENVVIAGDQQQMPPTDFFSTNINSDDDDQAFKYEDMESLLDDGIALPLARESLMWHYRSHHESLIAFSNNKFYENKLLTFPSPSNQVSQVKFIYVNGNYQKGKGINVEEAQAIVKEVMRRISDPLLSKKSIGIVTFNIKQQNLIDDMLSEEFSRNPEMNFTPGGEEIFIKNLENVQGDERDVILFSICYGKDLKSNTFSLNFGPLSREKGERRLNVAVSRSRDEMMVFSSLKPEEIAYQRAKNNGAMFLYYFLNYAKNGVGTLNNLASSSLVKEEKSLSQNIGKLLTKEGYKVDLNVGASSFKVDVAIKSEKNPSNYALGIILDGKTYSSSPTCSDRNIIQPSLLDKLHWHIIRVWSAEFLDRPNYVMEKIKKAYVQAEGEDNIVPTTETNSAEVNSIDSSKPNALAELSKKIEFEKMSNEELLGYPHNKAFITYKYTVNQSLSLLYVSPSQLGTLITGIVLKEGPISINMLYKKIRDGFSVAKIGKNAQIKIQSAIRCSGVYMNESYTTPFLWKSFSEEKTYAEYRGKNNSRPISEISCEELSNGMKDILLVQGQLTKEDLIDSAKRLFNCQALKSTSYNYVEYAVRFGLASHKFISQEKDGKEIFTIN